MAQTFWTGSSLSFTNGSKIVTVNTGPSVDSIYPNSKLKSGNYNEPVEVKAAYGSTIELYENWPGSTANTSATVTPSSAAAAAAGVAAQQVVTEIQNLVGSASATATANSFVKRDSNGRIKAANPSANDDVVTKGFIGSAATKNAGTAAGNVMEVGAFGWGGNSAGVWSDYNDFDIPMGVYNTNVSAVGDFPDNSDKGGMLQVFKRFGGTQAQMTQIYKNDNKQKLWWRDCYGGAWQPWKEFYHSSNTNFNEFGGVGANDVIARGFATSATTAVFYFPLNAHTNPTGASVQGVFYIRNPLSNSDIATGLTPTFSSAESSHRIGLMLVSTTGLNEGEPLEIITESSGSKIIFNF